MAYGKLGKGITDQEARNTLQKVMPTGKKSRNFQGTSPPSVFVGSSGYPKLNTGILSPQTPGSTDMLDSPKDWVKEGYSIERIASLRTSLVNSRKRLDAKDSSNFLNNTREIAMARKPVDVEVELSKRPGSSITGGRAKPVSASGDVEQFNLGENPSVERKIEDLYYDTDAKAETAVKELFSDGIGVYSIQQSMSSGMLGEEKNRRLVPTRWSITASDDITSKQLREKVKQNQQLGETRYLNTEYLGNRFHVFLVPGRLEFELIELKRSQSVWNSTGSSFVAANHESFNGRKKYAEQTAGAYYATRLAALEKLRSINRQSRVLVVRDVTPDYWAPLGVWIARETARKAMREGSETLENGMKDVKSLLSRDLTINYPKVVSSSKILQGRQSSLESFHSTSSW